MTTKDLNNLLKEVLGMEPLTEYTEPMPELSHEMRFAQAQMYAMEGYRKYLINEINRAIKNAALASDSELIGAIFKGRIITLRELLRKAEQSFKELEKIKKIKMRKKRKYNNTKRSFESQRKKTFGLK